MLDENAIVEKSKQLIWSKYPTWSAGELAVFDTYLSRINARMPESARVVFTKREYEQLMGLKEVRPEQLNKYIKHFMGNVLSMKTERGWAHYPLFEEAEFEKNEAGEWEVTLQCHNKLQDLFFNLAESGYQTYRLRYTLNLKSKYSKLLYCLLKDNAWKVTWEADLNELRELLGATDQYYDSFKEFNRKILKKAEEEINACTDLQVYSEKVTQGRRTKAVRFFITPIDEDEIPGQTNMFNYAKSLPKAEEPSRTGLNEQRNQEILENFRPIFEEVNSSWKITDEQILEINNMVYEVLLERQTNIMAMEKYELELAKCDLLQKILIRARSKGAKYIYSWLIAAWDDVVRTI